MFFPRAEVLPFFAVDLLRPAADLVDFFAVPLRFAVLLALWLEPRFPEPLLELLREEEPDRVDLLFVVDIIFSSQTRRL